MEGTTSRQLRCKLRVPPAQSSLVQKMDVSRLVDETDMIDWENSPMTNTWIQGTDTKYQQVLRLGPVGT